MLPYSWQVTCICLTCAQLCMWSIQRELHVLSKVLYGYDSFGSHIEISHLAYWKTVFLSGGKYMNFSGRNLKLFVKSICVAFGVMCFATIAQSASAPVVTNLPPLIDGSSTPVRVYVDALGNYFVSDPRGGGVIKYDKNGKRLIVYSAVKDAVGMAIAQNGELLVTHGTTVVRLNAVTGAVIGTFGSFQKAHGIAIDSTGNIYVTDSAADCVQKFDVAYNPVVLALAMPGKPSNSFGSTGAVSGLLKRPAGITYEKVSGQLAVADSLNGRIQFFTQAGAWVSNLGAFGSGPLKFTMPKNIAFEYSAGIVSRYYVVDSFQSNIQVIDAATKAFRSYIGGYGYARGELVSPSDVVVDQTNPLTPSLLVANETGLVTRYGIDSLQPTDINVLPATVLGQLTITWAKPEVPTFASVNIYQSAIADVLGTKVGSNIQGTSFNSTGLLANTTYYYTVRGVDSTFAETSNTDQYSGKTLIYYTLTAALSGSGGTISSNLQAPGLAYSNGVYTAPVQSGTTVTLLPTHDAYSIFKGWTGDVCNNQPSGNCVFTLTKATNVTAVFEPQHKFKIPSRAIYDDILQNIYSQSLSGETIFAMAGEAPAFDVGYASMSADANLSINIIGGFDSEYTASAGYTTVQGRVNITSGKVVFTNIKIK